MRRQITLEQRYQIAALHSENVSVRRISERLGFYHSTIYREIKRNSKWTGKSEVYDPRFAHLLSTHRHCHKAKRQSFTDDMRYIIRWLIRRRWSSEQIVNTCRNRSREMVSIETIYLYLYELKKAGIDLCIHLRRHHRKRRKRALKKQPRVLIKNKVSIHQRPANASNPTESGHI